MCRLPDTVGGGVSIENTGRGSPGAKWYTPCSCHHCSRRGSASLATYFLLNATAHHLPRLQARATQQKAPCVKDEGGCNPPWYHLGCPEPRLQGEGPLDA